MSAAMFRQEYLAQFIKDANAVFKQDKLSLCELDNLRLLPPQVGHYYVLGVDLAKHKDYTVITVIDRRTKCVVYHERFNKIDWQWQTKPSSLAETYV